jgi:alpha 1,2-mannosyltransferase
MQINLNDLRAKEEQFLNSYKPISRPIGRSIVTTCYHKEVASMWVLLNELNRLGCTLPIEIFHRQDELSAEEIQLLSSISDNVHIKKIQGVPKDFTSRYGHVHGWACKIYALYESNFAENLWIDADNYPIVDPSSLFDDLEYRAKGSLFWRDIMSPDSSNQYSDNSPLWPIFNIPPNDCELFETGQLLIDKNKCWQQFGLVKYYADNCEIYYNFGGDKETFKLAWQRIALLNGLAPQQINYHSNPNVPFGFMPFGPFHKGKANQYGKWGGGSIMVQRDREGKELFNHRNMDRITFGNNNTFNHDIANEQYYHDHIARVSAIKEQNG